MLSYQHAYHAGNHADLLKHLVLREVLTYLKKKPAPVTYVDSHAGDGVYDLTTALPQRLREFEGGVARALAYPAPPPEVAAFLEDVRGLPGNEAGRLSTYLGSPAWAQRWLGPDDRLHLFEQHPQAWAALEAATQGDPRVKRKRADGFEGALAVLRPPVKRALWLLDPAYERREEDRKVRQSVGAVARQFPQGIALVWYPVVERARADALLAGLTAATTAPLLQLELGLGPDTPGRGMTASGMVVLNPPYTLEVTFRGVLPWLVAALAPEAGFGRLQWLRAAP